jgi:plasmid stability protein
MASLQVKNVPDALFHKIRRGAAREGRTIRDFVLDAIHTKLAREQFAARLSRRRPVELGHRTSAALDEVRAERDRELGG